MPFENQSSKDTSNKMSEVFPAMTEQGDQDCGGSLLAESSYNLKLSKLPGKLNNDFPKFRKFEQKNFTDEVTSAFLTINSSCAPLIDFGQ